MDESKKADLTSQGNAVAPRELGMVHDLESRLSQQVENWRKKLLDLGNRNSLINCSFSKTHGVVEILHPNTETVWRKLAADNEAGTAMMRFPWRRDLVPMPRKLPEEVDSGEEKEWDPPFNACLTSQKFRSTDLMTGATDKVLNRRFRTLANHAELSLSEQGVHCLYVAFGFLKWFESVDSDQELRSPLMLVPVSLNRSTSDAPWELAEAEDDALENLCLRQRLKQDFGLELPSLPDIDVLEVEGARLQFLDAVRQAIAENTRWQVEDRCAIGRFAFPKIAMWTNLGEHRNEVISHPICRSIAGDSSISPMQAFGSTTGLPDASQLDDELAPGEIKAILDCDSSQIEAIVAAKRGVSFVLDGPPGTGKSQTIANIIADALAEGRRVLFVSEKVSALEVVKRRLDEFGLGDFCLECHSSKANRASVLEKLRMCMEIPTEVYPDPSPKLAEAGRLRDSLNKYVRAVHTSRPPLGLSPYELYGHISRLERLGMATRSRCRLPDSSSVTRDTFQSWLRVLERAEDLGDVLQSYATHPWRGCHLTSRSLSFSDDMQHHFGVLSKSFREIAEVTQPLVTAGLLPPVTPASHGETTKTLREAVQAPEVPSSWFSHATTVAKQVLARHASRAKLEESLFGLGDYVDDVLSRFPAEIAESLSAEPAEPWLSQIVEPLPDGIREQERLIVSGATVLDDVARKSEAVDFAVLALTKQLRIPIQSKIVIAAIPKLVRFARNVASCSPMREGWFAPENWSRLRESSRDAMGNLEDAERLASTLRGRLTAEKIPHLCRAMPEPQLLESAWSRIQSLVPTDTVHEIQEQRTRLQKLSEALLRTIESVGVVCRQLGINDASSVSFEAAHSLATWGVSLAQPVTVFGTWTDIATRIKVRKIAEESISDLREAGEVRQSLEDRLSHRAFKSSAADLSRRAAAFDSAFKRLLGGFGGIRKEAAELYKHGVPATRQLLSDLERLRVYHRRIGEAEDAAAENVPLLPPSHVGCEVEAWQHVLESVLALDGLCQAVPSLAVQVSVEATKLDPFAVKTGSEAIRNQLDQLRGLLDKTDAMLQGREGDSLASIAERVGAAGVDLKTCCDVADTAHRFLEQLPLTFPHLLTDVLNAFRCSEALVEATALFEREREIMPHGSTPSDRHGWERVIAGVDVAEFLNRLLPNDTSVRELFCREGSLDTAGLTLAGDSSELALQDLHLSLVKAEAIVSVSTPGAVAVAPSRRTPGELRHLADTGARQLNSQAVRLRQVSDVVRTDCDVPLSRLADDAASISKARDQDRVIAETETSLRALGVELPDQLRSQGLDAATWLNTAAASGSIHPLLEKAASDPTILAQCQLAAERNRAVCHAEFLKSWKFLQSVFDVKTEMSSGQTPFATDFDQLADILDRLRGETESLESWLKFIRWRRDMSAAGFDEVVRELLDQKYEPEQAVDAVSARFYRSLFDHLISQDTSLAEFDMDSHERLRERFRELDKWEVRAAATRIRQYQLGRDDRPRPGELIPGSSELGILMREVKKKRGHMPLRKLFAAIPKVLQALKPCIMMSPLSVSTFLQSNDIRFDLVIFDEASQVFPWDAMGAIYRGSQLIVAGDEQQLPPTNFFSRGDVESEDEDDEIGDFESILSVCKSINMPNKRLRWHYRSRREPLIAFSNRHFYSGELVTFPSARDASQDSVSNDLVLQGRWIDRKNLPEAERVADLVIEHHRRQSSSSMGVIAFNASQQNAILDAIYERRRRDPEIDALLERHPTEPFFVKNLENVQGDERDVIILSIGYGYNDAGKFLKNFGPLSKAGGARRLNVAVTRAREQIVLVSSVRSVDMDLAGSTSEGSHLLKAYLEYAERGVESLATSRTLLTQECESPFEQEVAEALIRRGLAPVPQVGCGGFRIDLALKHPERPGQFCLGVECDGATYHSSRTARDRDRIRQSVLEDLGWRIVRVWSTDWIRNPEKQIQRILDAYERSVAVSPDCAQFADPLLDVETVDDDLRPQIVNQVHTPGKKYSKIEDVSDQGIREAATVVLIRAGATDWDDLVTCVSRELGFSRTGRKIRDRLETILQQELRTGKLHRVGDRIALGSGNP